MIQNPLDNPRLQVQAFQKSYPAAKIRLPCGGPLQATHDIGQPRQSRIDAGIIRPEGAENPHRMPRSVDDLAKDGRQPIRRKRRFEHFGAEDSSRDVDPCRHPELLVAGEQRQPQDRRSKPRLRVTHFLFQAASPRARPPKGSTPGRRGARGPFPPGGAAAGKTGHPTVAAPIRMDPGYRRIKRIRSTR